jgi:arylsulfate sulfotransferase
MKILMRIVCLAIALSIPTLGPSAGAAVTAPGRIGLRSVQPGPTPFISFLFLTLDRPADIKSIGFTIVPKSGSVTRPVSVTYSKNYLQQRGFISGLDPEIMLPVFGLYANNLNTVVLTYSFLNGSTQEQTVLVPAGAFVDPCRFNAHTVIQARTTARDLSYDYILLKDKCGGYSPTIIDTDGEIRWVGIPVAVDFSSTLFQNGVYLATGVTLYRMEFDGASSPVASYPGTVAFFHHNIDYGKRGLILEADTAAQTEATDLEVDVDGNILKVWDLATIISNAMVAGGDDPSQFVSPAPRDWFHNNAVAYRKSDDSLVISSRENFVICIDYNTGAIKWILGDPTKKWFQFASLRQFALTLGPGTLPPIGQHSVSFTDDDKLLLFDDGQNSLNHVPAGQQRNYSAPRKYDINLTTRVATEIWNYPNGQSLFSAFCSSIYEDSPDNYLIDYSIISNLRESPAMELIGLSASGTPVFDYRYSTVGCNSAWNAIPVHLDSMRFTTIVPLNAVSRKTQGTAGTFDLPLPLSGDPGIECRSGGEDRQYQVVVTFPTAVTVAGATVTHAPGTTATVIGAVASGNQVTVNLSNVSNAQNLVINLIQLSDGVTTDTVSVPMSVLAGDSASNGLVNSSDIGAINFELGHPVTASNYRDDVTGDGVIDNSDLFLVGAAAGSGLP